MLRNPCYLQKIVFDRGVDGVDWWWLDPQAILCVVPAQANMAMTIDAQAKRLRAKGRPADAGRTRYAMAMAYRG